MLYFTGEALEDDESVRKMSDLRNSVCFCQGFMKVHTTDIVHVPTHVIVVCLCACTLTV